jgi:ribonuclease-3
MLLKMQEFEEKLKYTFKDKMKLQVALTHSSFANESKEKYLLCNERLEFLGDAVLSIIVSDFLFSNFKNLPEGELTRIRASLVCEKSLHNFAVELNLGKYLMLGRGEVSSGGRTRPSILADAFEAVLASIYLDGGMSSAKKIVLPFVKSRLASEKSGLPKDYKTVLQEVIQRNPKEKLQYMLKNEEGPDHDKTFMVEVHLNSNVIGVGSGHSKKEAEQLAAKEALELMGI